MPHLLKTSVAERDVAEIADYISHDNIDAALRFLDAVEQTGDLLVHWPHLGAAIDNQHIDELRRMQVKGFPNFLILYRPIDDGVVVLRVVHGARDLPSLTV